LKAALLRAAGLDALGELARVFSEIVWTRALLVSHPLRDETAQWVGHGRPQLIEMR
jgi:hypothetical protein